MEYTQIYDEKVKKNPSPLSPNGFTTFELTPPVTLFSPGKMLKFNKISTNIVLLTYFTYELLKLHILYLQQVLLLNVHTNQNEIKN